jgi:iron(III) transport system substrate-binding protein
MRYDMPTALRNFGFAALLAVCCSTAIGADSRAGSDALSAAASKEGLVTILGTNADDLNWIPRYFNKEYPGITVRIVTDLNVSARLITEDRAGRHDADVVWTSEALLAPLLERGLMRKLDAGTLKLTELDIGAQGHMAFTSSVTFVVAYNRNLVRPADVPQRWQDLLQPSFRGRMTSSPFLLARLCAALGVYQGEEPLTTFAQKLRSDSAVLWTNDLTEQVLASGERPFAAATAMHFVDRWIANGRPFAYTIPEPVFVTQFGSAVLKQAPHPNAAMLLTAWLSSPQGKQAREEAIYAIDLGPSSRHKKAVELRQSGKKIYYDSDEAREKRNALIPKMDRILSGLN